MAKINLDVAMQSTSEEILEKVKAESDKTKLYPTTFVQGSTTSTNNVNILNITGKGKFFASSVYASLGASTNASVKLQILIDGKDFFNVTGKSTSNGGTYGFIGVSPITDFKITSFGSYSEKCFMIGTVSTYGINDAYLKFVEKGTASLTSTESLVYFSPISDYVQFNESLSITVMGTRQGSGCEYFASYSLDE